MEPFSITLSKWLGKEIFSTIYKQATNSNKKLKISESNLEEAMYQHLSKINTFSSEISFKESSRPKPLLSVYIQLDLNLNEIISSPAKHGDIQIPKKASKAIEEVFLKTQNNVVLIGAPGSGKTTTSSIYAINC